MRLPFVTAELAPEGQRLSSQRFSIILVEYWYGFSSAKQGAVEEKRSKEEDEDPLASLSRSRTTPRSYTFGSSGSLTRPCRRTCR